MNVRTVRRAPDRVHKYWAGKPTQPLSWPALIADVEPTVASEQSVSIFLDTPDLRLARAGITLRHCLAQQECEWDLTVPLGADNLQTILVTDRRGQLPTLAEPLRRLTRLLVSVLHGGNLEPVAAIRSDRQTLHWIDLAGSNRLTVTEDRIKARRLPDGSGLHFKEIEIDPGADADPHLLHRVHALLTGTGMHHTQRSAFERVLGKSYRDATKRAKPGRSTVATTLTPYLRQKVAALQCADVAARAGLPDATHQLRAVCDGLRCVVRAYPGVLEPSATRQLLEDLQWLAAAARTAGDLEVLCARVTHALLDAGPSEVIGPLQRRTAAWFDPRQAEARRSLRGAMNCHRYRVLMIALQNLVDEPPWTTQVSRPAERVLADALRTAHRRVERRLGAAARVDGARRDLELRKSRKAANRLRYAAEAARPALGGAGRRVEEAATQLQDALDVHRDDVLLQSALREIAECADRAGESTFTFGVLYAGAAGETVSPARVRTAARHLKRAVARLPR